MLFATFTLFYFCSRGDFLKGPIFNALLRKILFFHRIVVEENKLTLRLLLSTHVS
jgi:hypothetical protein